MNAMEIVGTIALFWILGVSTWLLMKKREEQEASKMKQHYTLQLNEMLLTLQKLERDGIEYAKIADDAKKILNATSIATAFVPRNKRSSETIL